MENIKVYTQQSTIMNKVTAMSFTILSTRWKICLKSLHTGLSSEYILQMWYLSDVKCPQEEFVTQYKSKKFVLFKYI